MRCEFSNGSTPKGGSRCIWPWGGARRPMGRKHLFGRSKVQCKHSILPSTPHSTPHTFALALFSRARHSPRRILSTPQYMVVTAVTAIVAFKQPRARRPPPHPCSPLRCPLRAADCGNVPWHLCARSCMIPRRGLGSSPKRADSIRGLLPLPGGYCCAGALHALAMLASFVCCC